MTYSGIRSRLSEGILEIILDRPARKNAFTAAMYSEFANELLVAGPSPDVRVVLVHGEGGHFSEGDDLEDLLKSPPLNGEAPVFRFLEALASFPKPIVCAVAGQAVGIGTTLLLHADFVYAADDARFQLPFVNLGLVPEAASSLLLPKLCGYPMAAEVLMLGESFSAEVAWHFRLINGVVEEERLLQHAREVAAKLAKKPVSALMLTKRLLKASGHEAILQHMREEAGDFISQLQTNETQVAIQSVYDRRRR